jgi:hypothetical protein
MEEDQAIPRYTTQFTVWDLVAAVSSCALAVVSIVALGIGYAQIHEMREEARVQHLTSLVDKFDSADWVANRKSLALQRVDQGSHRLRQLDVDKVPTELDDELGFCEDLGLLTQRGYLDQHDVWNEFGDWLFYLYADARPYLDSMPSQADYGECKGLVESIRSIEVKEGASTYDHPSESDLYDSYIADVQRQSGHSPYRGKGHKRP